ncbi:hypothetical protein EDB85DRAFT_1894899 [Lactarius pseudohatsudake]|nr:hypothetical protein EDB85DRAFT_1894899 [Lactarius pseudohatsudake]
MDMLAEALLAPATSCRGRGDGTCNGGGCGGKSSESLLRCVPACANTICWDDGDYSEKRGDKWGGGLDDKRCMWLFDWSVSLFSSHTTPMQPLKRKRDELPTTPQKLRKIQLTIIPDSLDIPATPPPSPPPPSPVGDGVVVSLVLGVVSHVWSLPAHVPYAYAIAGNGRRRVEGNIGYLVEFIADSYIIGAECWEDDSERCGLVQRRTGGGHVNEYNNTFAQSYCQKPLVWTQCKKIRHSAMLDASVRSAGYLGPTLKASKGTLGVTILVLRYAGCGLFRWLWTPTRGYLRVKGFALDMTALESETCMLVMRWCIGREDKERRVPDRLWDVVKNCSELSRVPLSTLLHMEGLSLADILSPLSPSTKRANYIKVAANGEGRTEVLHLKVLASVCLKEAEAHVHGKVESLREEAEAHVRLRVSERKLTAGGATIHAPNANRLEKAVDDIHSKAECLREEVEAHARLKDLRKEVDYREKTVDDAHSKVGVPEEAEAHARLKDLP